MENYKRKFLYDVIKNIESTTDIKENEFYQDDLNNLKKLSRRISNMLPGERDLKNKHDESLKLVLDEARVLRLRKNTCIFKYGFSLGIKIFFTTKNYEIDVYDYLDKIEDLAKTNTEEYKSAEKNYLQAMTELQQDLNEYNDDFETIYNLIDSLNELLEHIDFYYSLYAFEQGVIEAKKCLQEAMNVTTLEEYRNKKDV